MQKRWLLKETPSADEVESLSKAINVNPFLSRILIQRGISSFEEAKKFFRPSLADLHDPFLMNGMDAAVERLNSAIQSNQKILIYGDYDVDGTTAVALVASYLTTFYPHCKIYIPDREGEGYGVSRQGVQWAIDNDYKLIVALDCGIKAMEMVHYANQHNVDFIICDHHVPDEKIPDAVAVLDPKRTDCNYPFKELSGCGLGFKFMQAYARRYRDESVLHLYLDLVAVSIASDIVPITDENRTLAYFGLKKLNENPVPGLKALKEIAGRRSLLDISGVVFTIGPRINASGRVAHADAAVNLLMSKTDDEAYVLAESINVKNEVRKQFDTDITDEAILMIESNDGLKNAKSTVLFKDTWHKGVIGIVASRCIERYYRPTIILTASNNKITGSARSVHGFNLYNAISDCGELLDKFGGHMYAAGLTLNPENLIPFQKKFEEVVAASITSEMLTPVIHVDLEMDFDLITQKFVNIIVQMAPFGPENQRPVFVSNNVIAFRYLSLVKEKHIRFIAKQKHGAETFNCIGFNMEEFYDPIQNQKPFRMAYTIEENEYNGKTSIQLVIKDIKFDEE